MGTLFQVYERVGNSLDEVYQRVRNYHLFRRAFIKMFQKDAHHGYIIEMY